MSHAKADSASNSRLVSCQTPGVTRTFLTNELGDVYAVEEDGVQRPIDPDSWGWINAGGKHDHPEWRRSIDSLKALPGFSVEEESSDRYLPGPRIRTATWGNFADNAAPPAAFRSRDGDGVLGYSNRLSEAIGRVAERLPSKPERSPMLINDFVAGCLYRVTYEPPMPLPEGTGTVYVLDDGFGIKIGYTSGPVAKRIGELQTGNPRKIRTIAEVSGATLELESLILKALDKWNITGEWFARDPIFTAVAGVGDFQQWIAGLVNDEEWPITVYPPYR